MPETFLYFAYGSNMCTKRLVRRVGEVEKVAVGYIPGRTLTFDKVSDDGSAKCDCPESKNNADRVYGVVFRVNGNRREDLDQAEALGRGYLAESLTIYPSKGETSDTGMSCRTKDAVLNDVLVYVADADHKDKSMQPYDWYKGYVLTGAQKHKLPADYVSRIVSVKSQPDPRPDRRTHKAASQTATVDSSKLAESTGAANAKQDQQQAALEKRDETGASKGGGAPPLTNDRQPTVSLSISSTSEAPKAAPSSKTQETKERPETSSKTATLGADGCLTSEQIQALRARARVKPLSDDIAEELSAALGLAQDIRSRDLYIEDAASRLTIVFDWLLAEPPQLILARDERRRLQIDCYRKSGGLTGLLARISAGTPTALVITALCASAVVWAVFVMITRALAQGMIRLQLHIFGFAPFSVESAFPSDQFFMDGRSLQVIVTAAFVGGAVSIATRLREFTRVRDLDPFSMFWTAMLKPLIGVVLSVFLFATLAGGVISFGFLPEDPFSLSVTDAAGHHLVPEKTLYVLWMLGFLAGFSERFAWDFVDRAQGIAAGTPGKKNSA